ncbi:putative class i alpha-mannosidase 1a [Phaeomoniella chlamydospora]|uniref:alpha-1,2-Mannosidase n=1 Tax=Phaeomoniella chlamydospora TaxID=158046 RepID=A0A0G2EYW6_PHACM|nr:putative class i alpha-mannosidase 1a [Phaeomoniella chlamydospora]
MFRLRRYRVFLIVAILTCITVYHLSHVSNWDGAANLEKLKGFGSSFTDQALDRGKEQQAGQSEPENKPAAANDGEAPATIPTPVLEKAPVAITSSSSSSLTLSSSSSSQYVVPTRPAQTPTEDNTDAAVDPDTEPAVPAAEMKQYVEQVGQGRFEGRPLDSSQPKSHWKKQPEHFPIPSASIIPLPSGRSKSIPVVQKAFKDESVTAKTDRERKLLAIKDAFVRAWNGYKEHALPHDELMPVTGEYKDPFNGWGATLVDTLDTLWIMGLKEEFETAVEAVKNIDFTTSNRKDIPVFETTIRYLGGLLAAYDISNQKYTILLSKAQELAEVLMGAFDTPNRMPQMYYNWAPSYASQPHRSGTRVVLAELGSLSMEFTRLAQLTRDNRYYDAIARITNELEAWQNNTKVPGLWPVHVDASGCYKAKREVGDDANAGVQEALTANQVNVPAVDDSTRELNADLPNADTSKTTKIGSTKVEKDFEKRQLDDAGVPPAAAKSTLGEKTGSQTGTSKGSASTHQQFDEIDCEPQGLASPPHSKSDKFTLGAMTDSTFEYLPKQHLLLGGQIPQYQTMYEYAMDAARKKLLFRPMTRDNRDILFSGKLSTSGQQELDGEEVKDVFEAEAAHLTCFAGGMFALGAKVFGIEGDLEIASKLTDGCIWAYESTVTHIMPEAALVVKCDDPEKCTWDETKWWDALDTKPEERIKSVQEWNQRQKELAEQVAATEVQKKLDGGEENAPVETGAAEAATGEATEIESHSSGPQKRQVIKSSITYEDGGTAADAAAKKNEPVQNEPTKTTISKVVVPADTEADPVATTLVNEVMKSLFTPMPIMSHEEFAKKKIEEQALPESYTHIFSRKYILRPEAIESVFIMYRITGDEYWREKGWKMFTAIQKSTHTEIANSAIHDVTKELVEHDNTMESFWLAETLKYFYLLFSDPSVVSLDDWVLNTEAHPFKRPA